MDVVPAMTGEKLAGLLAEGVELVQVEPGIFSVFGAEPRTNSYDTSFGTLYDRVACTPLYNRLVWGYGVERFRAVTAELLRRDQAGPLLDLGCGSLAFTAVTYARHAGRPVVLVDLSLSLLRMAKTKLIALAGLLPANLLFLQADATALPFRDEVFDDILSLNLFHVVGDLAPLLGGMARVAASGGDIRATTLVLAGRLADRYLAVWERAGELVGREPRQLAEAFVAQGLPWRCVVEGNMAFIDSGKP